MEKYKSIPIEGFKNRYKISNEGNIYSVASKKCLRQSIRNGYKTIYLCHEKTLTIHRLVAMAFIKNLENKKIVNHNNKKFVNHKNMKKIDNRLENLEWVTQSENTKHYYNSTTSS